MSRTSAGSSKVRASQHTFAQIPSVNTPRSMFNRSHGLKTTLDKAGVLYPIFIDEALPGDTMAMHATLFGRIATMVRPVMDNVHLDTHFFAVPMRLLWDNFEKFMGEQDNPGDTVDFVIPEIDRTTVPGTVAEKHGTLWDYMGLPSFWSTVDEEAHINALPFRALNLIWNEWFRDQNLQNSVPITKDDGPDDYDDYVLLHRGKRHDYFTSALPFPQKGPAVTLPLGQTAPVVGIGNEIPVFTWGGSITSPLYVGPLGDDQNRVRLEGGESPVGGGARWNTTNLEADLSGATAATINAIRQAFQIQRMYERDARGGSRYTEIIRSHFGISSDDARLQRPEYLGGGTAKLSVNPVAQSVDGSGSGNLADLGSFGVVVNQSPAWNKSFTEHCYIIGFASVRADLNYQEGLNKLWSRRTKFDYYWPTLAHLGEQAVLNKEIHNLGVNDDHLVWGYQERFAEYRYKPSQITGKMRSENALSLDLWHLAQDFGGTHPLLNGNFIQEVPPLERVIAVPSEPHFLLDVAFNYRCVRPMPAYSVPGLVDHF